MAAAYTGPERRAVITFTRDDSDRLVRVEEKLNGAKDQLDTLVTQNTGQNKRLAKLERKQSWMIGIGTTIAFIIAIVASIAFYFHV